VYRFRVSVDPKKTEKLVINETRPNYTAYALINVTNDQIDLFVRQRYINPEVEKALRAIAARKSSAADLNAQVQLLQKNIDQIFADQGRLRENMKALKGSAEEKVLLQRYTRQLDEEETQLDTLRKKQKETEALRDQVNAEIAKMIADLDIDTTL